MPIFRSHIFGEEKRLQNNFEEMQKAAALRMEAKIVEKLVNAK